MGEYLDRAILDGHAELETFGGKTRITYKAVGQTEIYPLTRERRADAAKIVISTQFGDKQQAFLDFVLAHYVRVGVAELDESKLTPLLRLKYHNSIADAVADLGSAADIRKTFTGFQKFLYEEGVAA